MLDLLMTTGIGSIPGTCDWFMSLILSEYIITITYKYYLLLIKLFNFVIRFYYHNNSSKCHLQLRHLVKSFLD